MKLFKYRTHHEGVANPTDAYVMFGRCYDSLSTESNGFYFRLANFTTSFEHYTDAQTFTAKFGSCRTVRQWMWRRVRNVGKRRMSAWSTYLPV